MLSENRRSRNIDLGARIRTARELAGYTQKALAEKLGLEYYTMISQMERGYVSIPPALWGPLSQVLDLGGFRFTVEALFQYQPDLYEALFGRKGKAEVCKALDLLDKGVIP